MQPPTLSTDTLNIQLFRCLELPALCTWVARDRTQQCHQRDTLCARCRADGRTHDFTVGETPLFRLIFRLPHLSPTSGISPSHATSNAWQLAFFLLFFLNDQFTYFSLSMRIGYCKIKVSLAKERYLPNHSRGCIMAVDHVCPVRLVRCFHRCMSLRPIPPSVHRSERK